MAAQAPLAKAPLEVGGEEAPARELRPAGGARAKATPALCRGNLFPQLHALDQPLSAVAPRETRRRLAEELGKDETALVHEVWDFPYVGGRTRFWCGGRCYQGPPDIDRKFTVCALTSILCPATFFFLVCSSTLWERTQWQWVPVLAGVLLAVTLVCMAVTSFTEPGIIPRPALQLLVPGLQEEVAKANGLLGKRGGHMHEVMAVMPDPFIMGELEPLGYWWCRWCHMIQPPRAKHCRDCDCCVLREDHHCPFLNNCVGQRNYAYFNFFVGSLTIFAAVAVIGIFAWMRLAGMWACLGDLGTCSGDLQRLLLALVGAFLVVVPGILIILLTGFMLFHIQLLCRNLTTREVLTGRLAVQGAQTLIPSGTPSMLHARDPILLAA